MDKPDGLSEALVRIDADHTMTKRLGNWTTARVFEVRARYGAVVLDLRSPQIESGDMELRVDLDHSTLKLLVPEGVAIDHFGGLAWDGKGRVKDSFGEPASDGRRIRLNGRVRGGEIRIHRNGMAMLSAVFSRAFLQDARRAHREGRLPTVDDPTRDPERHPRRPR